MPEQPTTTPNKYVLALLDNLFFAAKIKGAAASLGLQLTTAKDKDRALQQINELCPLLVIADLDAAACHPLEFIQQLKTDERWSELATLGFVAHVNTGVQSAARAAGFDRVLTRSVFSRDLSALLAQALGCQVDPKTNEQDPETPR